MGIFVLFLKNIVSRRSGTKQGEIMFNINKFPIVIISTRRSGSTPLLYELAKKYNIKLFNEIFSTHSDRDKVEDIDREQVKLLSMLEDNDNNFIIKIHLDDLKSYPEKIINLIKNHTCFLIRLRRKNIVNQITSKYIQLTRNINGYYNNQEADEMIKTWSSIKMPILPIYIGNCVKDVINSCDELNNAEYEFDKDIWYEDLVFDDKTFITTPKPINYDEIQNEIKRYFKRKNNVMTNKILIMGLPGAGKTTLAAKIVEKLNLLEKTVTWLNADEVRKQYDDWDFSTEGRIRQSTRMRTLADEAVTDYVVADFVAPLEEMRTNYKADWTIWVDTISKSRYADTNKAFVEPINYDFRITEQNAEQWSEFIVERLINNYRRPIFDWKKPTVQMLGRWQPWHDGHRALFERLMLKTGQVVIQIRDVQGWQDSNPFAIEEVKRFIRRDLDPQYQGLYEIQVVPNIVHIGWGRGVGYTSGEETFDESITQISATNIRKEMNLGK